jgi:hypothetical protein
MNHERIPATITKQVLLIIKRDIDKRHHILTALDISGIRFNRWNIGNGITDCVQPNLVGLSLGNETE